MRIALIGNSAQSVLAFRASLIRRLVERGHQVQAFAPDYDAQSGAAVAGLGAEPVGYRLQRSGTNPAVDLATVVELRARLMEWRPEAVLCYFIKPSIYGTLAAFLARVPRRIVMLEGLGYGFAEDAGASIRHRMIAAAMRGLLRFALARADRTLVLNEDDLSVVVTDLKVAQEKTTNIGGIGVELDTLTPKPVGDRATVFALAARLIEEKGVRQYVEAARQVRRRHPDTAFLLLGEVDDNPGSLQAAEVRSWVDEGLIEWPGRVSDVQAWLTRSDVFVLPSYYREGVPRSIQEAMALGRAIVTTDHVGCRDTVVPGVNGYLVPIKDVQSLTDAMLHMVEEPGLAQRMGRASRVLAEERFDSRRVDHLIIDLLEE
ncbi:glycosyltransferase family 4 protein [Sphingomonas floccifaciens]|uniref:Glycosyltransferase family 4 protein n=1 Tax=Sphingomonas floccifaciens TaxID=1844115 RepID=A0ABW4NGG5_9SPHN